MIEIPLTPTPTLTPTPRPINNQWDFISDLISKVWNFLFKCEFKIANFEVSFGALFCYSLLFVVGLRVVVAVARSYSKD